MYDPAITPAGLIPGTFQVNMEPGGSNTVRVPTLARRKPWNPGWYTLTIAPAGLMELAPVKLEPGGSIEVNVPSRDRRKP